MKISNELRGVIYAMLSGIFYGCIGYFGIKAIDAGMAVSNMLFWRFFIASIVMLPILPFTIKPTKCSQLMPVVAIGSLLYSVGTLCYYMACLYIGTGISMVIFYTYPVVVIILSWLFYRAQIYKVYYLAMVLIIVGINLVADISQVGLSLHGVALSLLSGVLYAIYIVISKKQAKALPPVFLTFALCCGCSAIFCIYSLANNSFEVPNTPELWGNLLGIGIIGTTLPVLFFLESLKHISAAKASIISVVEPVTVVVAGALLLNEPLSLLQIAGIIIILTGALLVQVKESGDVKV